MSNATLEVADYSKFLAHFSEGYFANGGFSFICNVTNVTETDFPLSNFLDCSKAHKSVAVTLIFFLITKDKNYTVEVEYPKITEFCSVVNQQGVTYFQKSANILPA